MSSRARDVGTRFRRLTVYFACLVLACAVALILYSNTVFSLLPLPLFKSSSALSANVTIVGDHPIERLILKADAEFDQLLQHESSDLHSAAEAYRIRRGRHPPPGFDIWYGFAKDRNALLIESLFDQIYDDTRPFWAVSAPDIRRFASAFPHRISVRNGNTTWRSDKVRPWMTQWHDMVAKIEMYLPDIDMAVNVMDESRVIAPWETVSAHLEAEEMTRGLVPPSETISSYGNTSSAFENLGGDGVEWLTKGPLWAVARQGCHPESAAMQAEIVYDHTGPLPPFSQHDEHLYLGYVSNWTQAKDPCYQPHLQTLHGTFIEPISMSTTVQLVPLFGGSKLPMNNEILIPAAMYWRDFSPDHVYSGGKKGSDRSWGWKENVMVWRGVASGGRNRDTTWRHFHRHRFISMVNSTTVDIVKKHLPGDPQTFELSARGTYALEAEHHLGEWVSTWSDVSFLDLTCFPAEGGPHCSYTNNFFSIGSWMDMKKMFNAKYLPDIDGNSFSGRYLAYLRSGSLPIKATIYNEWHDSRLLAWRHFIPMDNMFTEVYGIMDYFLSHDAVAHKIATQGMEWAKRVLREDDMLIYVYRLLLEYARICDDQREKLGYVDDIR